jgi:hypothetical protein
MIFRERLHRGSSQTIQGASGQAPGRGPRRAKDAALGAAQNTVQALFQAPVKKRFKAGSKPPLHRTILSVLHEGVSEAPAGLRAACRQTAHQANAG